MFISYELFIIKYEIERFDDGGVRYWMVDSSLSWRKLWLTAVGNVINVDDSFCNAIFQNSQFFQDEERPKQKYKSFVYCYQRLIR